MIAILHQFVSTKPDSQVPDLIKPSHWNQQHILSMDTGKILGRTTNGDGMVEEITIGSGLVLANGELRATGGGGVGEDELPTGGTTGQALVKASNNDGDVEWATVEGSGDMLAATYDPQEIGGDAFDMDNMADGSTNVAMLATERTKLTGIETAADVTDATNVAAAGAFMKASDDSDDITEGSTKLFMTTSERARLGELESGDTPQFAGIELSHASQNTLTGSGGFLFVEGAPVAFRRPGINAQTGTSYTLALTDEGGIVTMDNGSPNVATVPTSASIALPIGSIINILQLGAGETSIEGASGVTINGVSGGSGAINNRYQGATIVKVASDTWIASGDIGTVA